MSAFGWLKPTLGATRLPVVSDKVRVRRDKPGHSAR
ncbi:hypothetical protein FAES_3330 [Fibrella aestuarina BUZ 2]|uniref:Uncharacterized protein n=1 Tax=Fibrella aestuarina BUZ 2 TaxID=1166018 RepID=I0KB35_9BACT|nr:hypothetical protein FAES_3330 [Fibrella aestuarina BUZ 2]